MVFLCFLVVGVLFCESSSLIFGDEFNRRPEQRGMVSCRQGTPRCGHRQRTREQQRWGLVEILQENLLARWFDEDE